MASLDPMEFLSLSLSPLEIIIRGTLIFWFLFLIFRFVLRRDTGSVGISDILFVVILGDAAQNGMIGDGQTVGDAACLIATLVFWNYLLNYLGYHFKWVAKLTDPPAICMIRNGRVQIKNLRNQHLTRDEIDAKLRTHGVEEPAQVKLMLMESDGSFSVIKNGGGS